MTRPDVDGFFRRYGEAALSGEPARTSALYAPRFFVAAPTGSAFFDNDERFLEWLKSVHVYNQNTGLESMTVVHVDERVLSELHSIATVRWGARYAMTGDELLEFEITYLLERKDSDYVVLGYISHADQEEAMRAHGLV
jgi:hypothetical protein